VSKLSVIFKDRILSQHPLSKKQSLSIGSNSERDIFIDSLTFNALHATVFTENNKYTFALNEGAEGLINNQEIKGPIILKDGDSIDVGKYTLRYIEEIELNHRDTVARPFESVKKATQTYWLQFLNGKNVGKSIQLNQTVTNIGKAGTARVVLTKKDEKFYVSHLDGVNNAKVNNKPIADQEVLLNNNSTLELGQIKILFYIEEK